MGGLGSLTSCPGLKTAAVTTVGYSGYGKSLHLFHLLLFINALPDFMLKYFSPSRKCPVKSSNTNLCLPWIRIHP